MEDMLILVGAIFAVVGLFASRTLAVIGLVMMCIGFAIILWPRLVMVFG